LDEEVMKQIEEKELGGRVSSIASYSSAGAKAASQMM
jgi:hypothetical protein